MPTRREFLKATLVAGLGFVLPLDAYTRVASASTSAAVAMQAVAKQPLDPAGIAKFAQPLVIPPAMPRTDKFSAMGAKSTDYYEIAVRQFTQPILPPGLPATTVWSYGSVNHPGTFNYPAFTIEAKVNKPVRVKWINELKDPNTGAYLSHLLPVDQTLHWANPSGGSGGRDGHGHSQEPYTGPVPIVTHVHGAHVPEEYDGYPEAWFLPAESDIPAGYATVGTEYGGFNTKSTPKTGAWAPGSATFEYPNQQRAGTLWYHDHTLGMTRLNVYAGPAGFYVLRGGPGDLVLDNKGRPAVLPGPAPALGDLPGAKYYEIPVAIQDRSFHTDGSLSYPDNRAFFEDGRTPAQLQIPFIPDAACGGEPSDVSPIWNPEFFGDTMVVNGKAWPFLDVERRRYRFRFLNGCNSRFLILKLSNDMPFVQIATEGGFLPAPVTLTELLMSPAERADVIVDFGALPAGTKVVLQNLAPDEPFGGGTPGVDFDPANPATTGKVMEFRVVGGKVIDPSTPPANLVLPTIVPIGPASKIRQVSLNELDSSTVLVTEDESENIVLDCEGEGAEPFGPIQAVLGTLDGNNLGVPMAWMDPITENPGLGATEVWEIHNFTMDAHPIHIHEVMFQVVDRQPMAGGAARPPEAWETGFKDTVIAYPDEITRVRATFDIPGLFVWHCHIVEHEDNEMMRPMRVGP